MDQRELTLPNTSRLVGDDRSYVIVGTGGGLVVQGAYAGDQTVVADGTLTFAALLPQPGTLLASDGSRVRFERRRRPQSR